jgi:hypothetical protein
MYGLLDVFAHGDELGKNAITQQPSFIVIVESVMVITFIEFAIADI